MTARMAFTLSLSALVLAVRGAADPPPATDGLTELSAAQWSAAAQSADATVADDTSRVRVGSAALRFDTTGGFDTWLWAPAARDADWDLLASGAGGVAFWVYADNPNSGFQGGSPWIRLHSSPTSYIELHATGELLNEARGVWKYLRAPLTGDADWSASSVGSPDLSSVRYLEIHADTWEAGFSLWIDGLTFDLPIPPPGGQVAYAGNHRVSLAWEEYGSLFGAFDHYAVYRATESFSDVSALTPIAIISDVQATAYVDASAENGVGYYYALTVALTSGAESTEIEAIGPRTPRNENDVQLVSIARTPRYPRYDPTYSVHQVSEPSGFGPYIFTSATGLGSGQSGATQRWPDVGDDVTYTATVRNRGTNLWRGTLNVQWLVDGAPAGQAAPSVLLQPGQMMTFDLAQTWDGAAHEVRCELDVNDDRAENNALAIDAKSVAFLSYVDLTYAEDFREDSANYPGAYSDDVFDWLNHHMLRFNELFAYAGCGKRVHFDVLELLADGAPDPSVPRINFAIFPFRYKAGDGSLRLAGYYSASEDIDYGLLHEMGHQLGLIDLYRLNLTPEQNLVNNAGYSGPACLMNGVSHFVSEHSAHAMNRWLNVAHGYFGQYLYALPEQVRLRILDVNGAPLSGATVRLYQKVERPGQGEVITPQVKAEGVTDAAGEWTLPNVPIDPALVPTTYAGDTLPDNPFGYVAVVGTNGVLLIEVEHNGFVDYAWLDITEVNNAYAAGQTQVALFERQVALGGAIETQPPDDLTEQNAASWLGWAQDGTITLTDDANQTRVGQTSLRISATGGFDNYARYPGDHLAIWDLSETQWVRVWMRAVNPNGGFQNHSPWVRLGNQDGFYEWRPTSDLLNQAIGQWVEFAIPIAGDATWPRSVFGAPALEAINYIEVHADTWGAGFTLWMDGLRFDPPPCVADLDGDGEVGLSDLATVLSNFGTTGGATLADGDFDVDGDVDLLDLAFMLSRFGAGCT